jgi:hypothetical protein
MSRRPYATPTPSFSASCAGPRHTDFCPTLLASLSFPRPTQTAHLRAGRCLPHAFTVVSCSAYSSTRKTEAACSSETLVDFQLTTKRSIITAVRTTDLANNKNVTPEHKGFVIRVAVNTALCVLFRYALDRS